MAKAEAKPASSTTKPKAEPTKKAPPVEEVDDREEDLDEDGELEEEEGEEDDEEEDDEEEEEEARAKGAKKPPVVRAPAPSLKAPVTPDNDPTWWIPHAVLGVIVLIGVFGFFGFFNGIAGSLMKKSAPATSASAAPTPAASAAAPTSKPSAMKPAPLRPGAASAVVDADPTFGGSRIVVRYKGAKNSKQERTKEQAKARAGEALQKLGTGAKFEDVAAEFSDEETAKTTGGKLGNFKRGTYDPILVQTVEKLEVGKTSAVFESPEGYEIVTRSK